MFLVSILALGLDATVTNADFTFGEPTNLGPTVNSSAHDEAPSISADGLTLYFNSNISGGYGNFDLWMTTRPTKDDPWGPPENLGPTVNSPAREQAPSISGDGLSLYFMSTRSGGYGPAPWGDIWVTERATTSAPWGASVNLGPVVNGPLHVFRPCISHDGLSLFFGANRVGGLGNDDLWVTARATTDNLWQESVNLGSTVNSPAQEGAPSISADGLALFFSGYALEPHRAGGFGNADIWMTRRPTVSDLWGSPVNLGPPINTSSYDFLPSISADGSTLYFMSDRPGGYGNWDLWEAPVIPVVDFNGDEIVDSVDMCIMVDNWGTDNSLCDIGPMPWGDGIVDVQDLIVLAGHLFEEILPIELVAYWKLDETEGETAREWISGNDDVVIGVALWQPAGGKIGGALELDGVDDHIVTTFGPNPAEGPFSVFAWIKGGAPGQVVLSQTGGANWLLADPSEGKLQTSLLRPGGGRIAPQPLISEFIITDGTWHRIGFVWDGTSRILYVDDIEVARDTQAQASLEAAYGGLYFGAGSTLDAGSFFSGLIDDVRIYNRAVMP
jgi:hypothetical protein